MKPIAVGDTEKDKEGGNEGLSLNAMKFGSEEDFKIAITELKWIIRSFGKATKRDFHVVSSKYNFPIDFLKQGLEGLQFPDDYKISKSKWFPIIYSWTVRRREISYKLFRLQIDYLRSRFSLIRTFAVLIGASQLLIIFINNFFMPDLLGLSLLVISFVLFFIGLFFEMKTPLSDKKMALDEYTYLLKQKGLGKIIEDNEIFLKSHNKLVVYAGNILKKKLEEARNITIFGAHVEDGTLFVKDWEDPNLEYKRRISELGKF